MNTLYLYASEVSVSGMKQFLEKIELAFNYIMLEFYDRVIFEKFDSALLNDEGALNRGRAFNNECEIKWRRNGDRFVVALTAGKALDDRVTQEFEGVELTYSKRVEPEDGFLLWGKYLDQVEVEGNLQHRWFEKRIPQPQFYPVNPTLPYVRLKTTDYYDDEGRLIGRRLIEPYPWKPKEEEEKNG